MSQCVEVKTAELVGQALDWAVAKALGYECGRLPGKDRTFGCNAPNGLQYVIGRLYGALIIEEIKARFFRPSTDWAQGGPLIDKYNIWLSGPIGGRKDWSAAIDMSTDGSRGPDALTALCRAIAAAKLGGVVQIPAELVGREEKI